MEKVTAFEKEVSLSTSGFVKMSQDRTKKILEASAISNRNLPPANRLAKQLHPAKQTFRILDRIEHNPEMHTFVLQNHENTAPWFRPGQCVYVDFEIDGSTIVRPYSISSSPAQALTGVYEITVKKVACGFATNYIFDHWKPGTDITCSGPQGNFYYDDLRDAKHIVGIAGGVGITPYVSMIRSMKEEGKTCSPPSLTLIYGVNSVNEIAFRQELQKAAHELGRRIKVVYVVNDDHLEPGMEAGLINKEIIQKYGNPEIDSFFVCGPPLMYDYIQKEFSELKVLRKQIRFDVRGERNDIVPLLPEDHKIKQKFRLTVKIGASVEELSCNNHESLLVSMERGGLYPPAGCRSGECAYCRSKLIDGSMIVIDSQDGRRMADYKFGYIHPCVSYPTSNVSISIPRKKSTACCRSDN
jgi:glycine betaine catabolism B